MSESEASRPRARDASIDVLRGLVMCLMVLDHVRDFSTETPFDPTDPDKTHLALFVTRWITHFCAPVFVLLAGAGVGIARERGRDRAAISTFLLSRGLWLLVLEVTIVRYSWFFNVDYRVMVGQVIWALGWSMIVLAAVVWLPSSAVLVGGALIVGAHNLFDRIDADHLGGWSWLWHVVHQQGAVRYGDGRVFFVAYPLVPWIGVMMLGYVLGLHWPRLDRRRLAAIGGAALVAFVVLRATNLYGDPRPFVSRPGLRGVFAFLDCQKYPPSLAYLLMTLGPALLVLAALRGRALAHGAWRALDSFGRAPLFFYVAHLFLVHSMTFPFRIARGLPLVGGPFRHGLDLSLSAVYALWLLALALLWWPTHRWAELKRARSDWWLSYL
jgi:uncharacterized membrane protein